MKVEFNQSLDPATLQGGAGFFQLLDANGNEVAGESTQEGDELEFRPDNPLDPNSEYTIHLGTSLASDSGLTLDGEIVSTFTTGSGGSDDADDT